MEHIAPDLLQRYLDGETDLMETESIDEHLSACSSCSDLIARFAADDATLAEALELDQEDLDWAQSVDLTAPIMQSLTPWYRNPQTLPPAILVILAGAWGLHIVSGLLHRVVDTIGFFRLAAGFGPVFLGFFLRILRFMHEGGLLAGIWLALVLGPIVWFWLHNRKERTDHAQGMG